MLENLFENGIFMLIWLHKLLLIFRGFYCNSEATFLNNMITPFSYGMSVENLRTYPGFARDFYFNPKLSP